MKIDTISIEGCKSFAKVGRFALRDLNALIGANGAGKSNFLSLFRLMTAVSQGCLQTCVQPQGGPDSVLHRGRKRSSQLCIGLTLEANAGIAMGATSPLSRCR